MSAKRELLSNSPVLPTQKTRQMAHPISRHFGTVAGVHGAFNKMKTVKVHAGDEIVRYRDKGHQYYIILKGEAEVWKPDPEADIWSCVDRFAQGDAFGEEAILIGGFRNATVRMITQGVLLVLDEGLFNSTLRSRLVQEVTPERAQVLAGRQDTEWLDCRFDIEYAEVRIPHARLLPLHTLRQSMHQLDKGRRYLVYCRSGRRSVCAAYLLRERGFNAVSVKGGVRAWPYELEHTASYVP